MPAAASIPMTPAEPAELARAIRAHHCAAARNRPLSWELLPGRDREQLVEEARRLLECYRAGGDAPSRGMR